jgi:hypothetical protein
MSNRSRQTTTSTAQTTPFGAATGGINAGLNAATNYINNPNSSQAYGGPRVADLSGLTQQGVNNLGNNQGYGQATDYYQGVLNGNFLNAENPYLQNVQRSVTDRVMPGINATFGRAGMTGSTIHQNQLATGLGNAMAPLLFQNYENERNRQAQAANLLPTLYGQQARDQLTAGSVLDQQNQNLINADMAAFEENRTAPIRAVNEALPMLMQAGSTFGTRTGTETREASPSMFNSLMGAGMMGLRVLGGPTTAAASAALPGLAMGSPFSTSPVAQPSMFSTGMPVTPPYNPNAMMFGNIGSYY